MSADRPYRYVFGPVASRRLGRSLGVDLVPFKVCPLDCIYCQLGATVDLTTRRAAYVPVDEVLDELRRRLGEGVAADHVTLSGSGEPTLHSELATIVAEIKRMTTIPLAVLTNGMLLGEAEVRRALLPADVVIPNLDAGDEATFQRINRPATGLTLAGLVDGLIAFRREFRGRLLLEVFLVAGINDSDEQVARMAELVRRIEPDGVEVNTVVRPPAEAWVQAVEPARLARLAEMLGPAASVIATRISPAAAAGAATADDVLALVRRHPATVEDICLALQVHPHRAAALLDELLAAGQIVAARQGERVFYQAPPE